MQDVTVPHSYPAVRVFGDLCRATDGMFLHSKSTPNAEYAQPVDDELVVAERHRTFSSGLRQVPNVNGVRLAFGD